MANICKLPCVRGFHSTCIRVASRPSKEVDSIIRVDHAGELGADRIYAGQMAVLGNSKMAPLIQHMWEQEKGHKAKFEELIRKYRVRPTALVPVWNVAGFLLGAGSALLGEKAAMACTVAVESVIVDHYNDQLRTLMADPQTNKELLDTIQKFRDEEQEHHDTGLDQGAEQAPFYSALTEVIKVGCKTAIALSKGLFKNPYVPIHTTCRTYSTTKRDKWDLASAICVERKPVITLELTELQSRYLKVIKQIEYERSHKSNHEMRHEKDERNLELMKKNELVDVDSETSMQTAQDFEDSCNEEYNQFKFAPRVTEADKKNDVRSLKRALDSHLMLLVNKKLGKDDVWMVPQDVRRDGETMRETAERVLREQCGTEISTFILGNAPFGFYKYRYPKSSDLESVGAKVFFFKAVHVSGQAIIVKDVINDFRWSTRVEMSELLKNKSYLNSINQFLFDEEKSKQAES